MPSPEELQKIIDQLQKKADRLNQQAVATDDPLVKKKIFLDAINSYKIALGTNPPLKDQQLQLHLSMLFCYDMLILIESDKKEQEDYALQMLEIISNIGVSDIKNIQNQIADIHHQSDICAYFLTSHNLLQQSANQAFKNKANLKQAKVAAKKIIELYPKIEKEYYEKYASTYKKDYVDCHAVDKKMAQEFLTTLSLDNSQSNTDTFKKNGITENADEEIEYNLDEPNENPIPIKENTTTSYKESKQEESTSQNFFPGLVENKPNNSTSNKRKQFQTDHPTSFNKLIADTKRKKVKFNIGSDDFKASETQNTNLNSNSTSASSAKFFKTNQANPELQQWVKIVEDTFLKYENLQSYNKEIIRNFFYEIAICHLTEFEVDKSRNKKHLKLGYSFLELAHKLEHKNAADKQEELHKQFGYVDKKSKSGLWSETALKDKKLDETRKLYSELQTILYTTSKSTLCVQRGANLDCNNAQVISTYFRETLHLYLTEWLPKIYLIEKHTIKLASILMSKLKLTCTNEEQKNLFRTAESQLRAIWENKKEAASLPPTTQASMLPS